MPDSPKPAKTSTGRKSSPTDIGEDGKVWVYINFDHLSLENPLLELAKPNHTHVLFVETSAKPRKRPYHKQKLVLLISAMRHFAEELKKKGYHVHYEFHKDGYKQALESAYNTYGFTTLHVCEIWEWEVREEIAELDFVKFHPNPFQLSTREDWLNVFPEKDYPSQKKYLHETFYRFMRKKHNLLIDNEGKPIGGKWNHDHENRKKWTSKDPLPLPIPWITPDHITKEVIAIVNRYYSDSFGSLENFGWPVTRKDSLVWLEHFISKSLVHFGKFEDAMDIEDPFLFHSLLSPLIHLGLLHPMEVIERAIVEYESSQSSSTEHIPISSLEGFIRQILGWREYMRNIYQENREMFQTTNFFGHKNPLPELYWGKKSGMRCLDSILETVWNRGYSHHITRLMVLTNFANLIGTDPHELNEWFWFAYVDAYEWVVTPNVIGMGSFADGGFTATKPYIASANYIKKMAPSYCRSCRYRPDQLLEETACPFNALYWNFIGEKEEFYSRTRRTDFSLNTWNEFPEDKKKAIRKKASKIRTAIVRE